MGWTDDRAAAMDTSGPDCRVSSWEYRRVSSRGRFGGFGRSQQRSDYETAHLWTPPPPSPSLPVEYGSPPCTRLVALSKFRSVQLKRDFRMP